MFCIHSARFAVARNLTQKEFRKNNEKHQNYINKHYKNTASRGRFEFPTFQKKTGIPYEFLFFIFFFSPTVGQRWCFSLFSMRISPVVRVFFNKSVFRGEQCVGVMHGERLIALLTRISANFAISHRRIRKPLSASNCQ